MKFTLSLEIPYFIIYYFVLNFSWQKDANLDKEKAELKSLIQLIRFPLMSVEDLQTIVAPTGLLNEKELTHIINYVSGAVG